jgi:hypothetical protein
MAAEISRARKRANARQARKVGATGLSARQIVALTAGVFAGGIAIGVTAGLLIGSAPQSPEARRADASAAEAPPREPTVERRAGAPIDHAGAPSATPEHAASADRPAGGATAPAQARPNGAGAKAQAAPATSPSGDLTQTLDVTEQIVREGRRRAAAARAEAAASAARAQPAWQRNAAAYTAPQPETPRIAIVIDDLGLNRPNARETLKLPGPLTLAFMTYAPGPGELARAARRAGHELLVHVPMQPSDHATDPGPKVLSSDLDRSELLARLDWGLSRFDGYVGINNHMGSAFTRDAEGMRTVLAELKRRGLMFLDSRTIGGSVAGSLAQEMGVAHATRDVFLDNRRDVAAIRAQLEEAERIARKTGSAVAIGHPYDETIQALSAWLPTLAEKKIALVPISALAEGRGPDVARLPGTGAE